jgi:non-heme chloroperoxidase
VPVLVLHGDDDQIVPYSDSAPLSAKLLKNGMLETYKGFPHGMPTTEAEAINTDCSRSLKVELIPEKRHERKDESGANQQSRRRF